MRPLQHGRIRSKNNDQTGHKKSKRQFRTDQGTRQIIIHGTTSYTHFFVCPEGSTCKLKSTRTRESCFLRVRKSAKCKIHSVTQRFVVTIKLSDYTHVTCHNRISDFYPDCFFSLTYLYPLIYVLCFYLPAIVSQVFP